jgi:hypothetical protein
MTLPELISYTILLKVDTAACGRYVSVAIVLMRSPERVTRPAAVAAAAALIFSVRSFYC